MQRARRGDGRQQHAEDRFGRIGVGRERVGGEDRQREEDRQFQVTAAGGRQGAAKDEVPQAAHGAVVFVRRRAEDGGREVRVA